MSVIPFEDGNGRIGRLWQTEILTKWKPIFEYIPIETLVYQYQANYYLALEKSRYENSANPFISFMLNAVNQVLAQLLLGKITDKLSKTELEVLNEWVGYLQNNEHLTSSKAQELTGKSPTSVKKYLAKFTSLEILIATGQNKGRKYSLNADIFNE